MSDILETTYELITRHQKLICVLNILQTIENPNNKIIQSRMLVEDEIQESWELIRKNDGASLTFLQAQPLETEA